VPSPSYEIARCVVCGHADASVVADADDMRAEAELLWQYHGKRLRPETPTPRLMDRVAFSEPRPFRLVRCAECGLLYRNPVERAVELTEMYARAAPAPDVLRALHDTQVPALRVQARELRRSLAHNGTGLEVGSYVGAFLEAARDQGLQFEGLDINPHVNEFTRSLGFAVHDGELESFTADRTFDAVAIWNTFDQLANPRGVVHAAYALLRPGGTLALRVPNGAFYAANRPALARHNRVGRMMACAVLAQNNLLTFPYRWGFTPSALTRLLAEHGFTVKRIRGDVLVPIADEWTRRWARVEEILIKRLLAAAVAIGGAEAPWFEIYAKRE
jgi:2-polyprenyl-3-methyl-5-hydroxy-6-metoxy-1,4-benzoquinol methylase